MRYTTEKAYIKVRIICATPSIRQNLSAIRLGPIEPGGCYWRLATKTTADLARTYFRECRISTDITPKNISRVLIEERFHLRLHDILNEILLLDVSSIRLVLA